MLNLWPAGQVRPVEPWNLLAGLPVGNLSIAAPCCQTVGQVRARSQPSPCPARLGPGYTSFPLNGWVGPGLYLLFPVGLVGPYFFPLSSWFGAILPPSPPTQDWATSPSFCPARMEPGPLSGWFGAGSSPSRRPGLGPAQVSFPMQLDWGGAVPLPILCGLTGPCCICLGCWIESTCWNQPAEGLGTVHPASQKWLSFTGLWWFPLMKA